MSNMEFPNRKPRTYHFLEKCITCLSCALNYSATDGTPTFCQEFSIPIDPTKIEENNERGLKCEYWHPQGLDRFLAWSDTEEHIRWYEEEKN